MGTRLLGGQLSYGLLILLALLAAGLNYFIWARLSHALPNTIGVYSIREVNNYDVGLYTAGSTKNVQSLATLLFNGVTTVAGILTEGDLSIKDTKMTELQTVKYLQGCYGDLDIANSDSYTAGGVVGFAHGSTTDVQKTKLLNDAQVKAEGAAGTPSVCSCIDEMFSKSLTAANYHYVGSGAWLFPKYALAAPGATITSAEWDKYVADYPQEVGVYATVAASTLMTKAEFVAQVSVTNTDKIAMPDSYVTFMRAKYYAANMFAPVQTTPFLAATMGGKYHEDLTRVCVEAAPPMHALSYEDAVPAPLYLLIGQLFLIVAAMQINDSFVRFADEEANQEIENEEADKRNKNARGNRNEKLAAGVSVEENLSRQKDEMKMSQYIKIFLVLLTGALMFILSIVDFNILGEENDEFFTFRLKEHRHPRAPVITLFGWVTTGIVVLVTLFFEYTMLRAHASIRTRESNDRQTSMGNYNLAKERVIWAFHKNGNVAMVLKHIACDVPLIAGFALVGIGILSQSDVTSVHVLVGSAFFIVLLGFMQHISNVIKGLYTRLCARLDAGLVVDLTLYDQEQDTTDGRSAHYDLNPGVKQQLQTMGRTTSDAAVVEQNVRPILQFFGYSRLYIFAWVVFGTLALVFSAKETPLVLGLHGMLDGQFLYFAFAFLFCNVGFDLMYEILPFMFESTSSENMRVTLLLVYVIFVNLNQILYFYRLPV